MTAVRFKKDTHTALTDAMIHTAEEEECFRIFCRMSKQNRAHESQLVFSVCTLKAGNDTWGWQGCEIEVCLCEYCSYQ